MVMMVMLMDEDDGDAVDSDGIDNDDGRCC